MSNPVDHVMDASLDLVIERTMDAPAHLVWKALTTPALMEQWFAPRPCTTSDVVLDLRPGGQISFKMQCPDGLVFEEEPGCVLEVIEGKKFVWTSTLGPGYRPRKDDFLFTAVLTVEAVGDKTHYRALMIHGDIETRTKHMEIGFHEGWGVTTAQLEEVAISLK